MYVMPKKSTQIDYVTRTTKNVSPQINSLWYPTSRPLQHYRKTGTSSIKSDFSFKKCVCGTTSVGIPLKMIGKNDAGDLNVSCCTSSHTSLKPYYPDYHAYLKSRGNTYLDKSLIHKIPGVDYTLSPNDDKMDSSHFYENNITESEKCKITIYKPSNEPFSTQGGVDSSAVISRAKYLAITKNNASFIKPYGIRIPYNETQLFFAKNKVYNCKKSLRLCM
jgi:hypothetical protein